MLALCRGGATRVRLSVEGTDLRPALIVRVSQDSVLVDGASAKGFFDYGGEGHPGGAAAALMAACVLRVARLHGGRADVQPLSPRGCTMTLVVPRFGRHWGPAVPPLASTQAPRDQLGAGRRHVRILHDLASIHDLYRPIQFERCRGRARSSIEPWMRST